MKIYLLESPYMDIIQVSLMLPVCWHGIEPTYINDARKLTLFLLLAVH